MLGSIDIFKSELKGFVSRSFLPEVQAIPPSIPRLVPLPHRGYLL